MSDFVNDLYTALQSHIATVWPECASDSHGIFEADHVEVIPWEELTPPYAVIAIDRLPHVPGFGASNQVYQPDVRLFYVAEIAGPLSSIRTKLTLLENDLLTRLLTVTVGQTTSLVGQVMEVSELCWSTLLPPNQIFISKGMTHRAGCVTARITIGRIITDGV